MKQTLSLLLLLFTSAAFAKPNEAQFAKAKGLTPGVPLAEVANTALDPTVSKQIQENVHPDGTTCGHIDGIDYEIGLAEIPDLVKFLGMTEEECKYFREQHRQGMRNATVVSQFPGMAGTGAYPAGCDPEYPGVNVVKYWVNEPTLTANAKSPLTRADFQHLIDAGVYGPAGINAGRPFTMQELTDEFGSMPRWQVSLVFCEEIYRQFGCLLKQTQNRNEANILKKMRGIPGSTIGLGWFPTYRDCPGDTVELHTDTAYRPSFRGFLGLDVHEFGHCLQLRHFFTNQNRNKSPMSYRYSNQTYYVGYVKDAEMAQATGLPISPEVANLKRYYGGEPVGNPWKGRFATTPDPDPDPDPDPSPGVINIAVGMQKVEEINGKKLTWVLAKIEADEGPGSTLEERIKKAYDEIPDYAQKDAHRARVAELYEGFGQAAVAGESTVAEAQQMIQFVRGFLLSSNADDWAGVFAVADSVTTGQGLLSVATGLNYQAFDDLGWGAMEHRLMAAEMKQSAEQQAINLPPQIITLLNNILDNTPFFEDKPILKLIIQIALSFLTTGAEQKAAIGGLGEDPTIQKDAQGRERAADPEPAKPAKREAPKKAAHFRRPTHTPTIAV